jgi:hypothetical protein
MSFAHLVNDPDPDFAYAVTDGHCKPTPEVDNRHNLTHTKAHFSGLDFSRQDFDT